MTQLISLLILLCSCFSRPNIMTRQSFQAIYLGEPVTEFEKQVGSPYAIRQNPDGSQDYEYIERIRMGDEVVEENRYYLVIKNNQVVSKRINQETPPAFDLLDDDDPNDTDQQ